MKVLKEIIKRFHLLIIPKSTTHYGSLTFACLYQQKRKEMLYILVNHSNWKSFRKELKEKCLRETKLKFSHFSQFASYFKTTVRFRRQLPSWFPGTKQLRRFAGKAEIRSDKVCENFIFSMIWCENYQHGMSSSKMMAGPLEPNHWVKLLMSHGTSSHSKNIFRWHLQKLNHD